MPKHSSSVLDIGVEAVIFVLLIYTGILGNFQGNPGRAFLVTLKCKFRNLVVRM
jgi:hypothetical protein